MSASTMPAPAMSASEAEEFRARCRAFLDEHATGIRLDGDPDPRGTARLAQAKQFQGELAAAGLAGITYPVEYGGAGLGKEHERIWRETYAQYPDMTSELTISHGMCLPMLFEYGTHDQKAAYLADNIAARTVWCQMFSEPGAGSDVASLQTKAERDGDTWVLSGQKVWTTLAHVSDYGVVIARTNPEAPKHAGISMFIVAMDAEGIEVRPIHQIDGGMHFNEVFFTEVALGADALLGEQNNGWNMATAMLMYERVAIGTGTTSGIVTDRSDQLIAEATKRGIIGRSVLRQRLMRLRALEATASLVRMRTRAELQAGKTPGPGGSLTKLLATDILALYRDLSLEVIGPASVAWDSNGSASWQRNAISTMQAGIAGGTNEIQRNIIGDRVLGLPRDIDASKGVPFKDLKVGTQQ